MSDHLTRAQAQESDPALVWLAGYDPGDGHGLIGQARPEQLFNRSIVEAAFAAGRLHATTNMDASLKALADGVGLLAEAAQVFRSYAAYHRAKAIYARQDEDENAGVDNDQKAARNDAVAARIEAFLLDDATPRDRIAGLALSLVQDLEASGGDRLFMRPHNPDLLQSYTRLRDALDRVAKPGQLSAAGVAAQEAVVGAALDAGIDEVGEGEERPGWAAGVIHEPGTDPDEAASPAATVRTIEAAVEGGLIPGLSPATLQAARDRVSDGASRASGGEVEIALSTPDPRFDPRRPVTINGFAFGPAVVVSGMDPEVVDALRVSYHGAEPAEGTLVAAQVVRDALREAAKGEDDFSAQQALLTVARWAQPATLARLRRLLK